MKRAFALISLIIVFFAGCSDDSNAIDTHRNLNLLEEKLIGTWGWAAYNRSDTMTFNRNFSYTGKMDGEEYSGNFNLTLDSTLTMIGSTNFFGVISTDDMRYTVHQLTPTILVISAASREQITYRKVVKSD